jgi:hypothetical protein
MRHASTAFNPDCPLAKIQHDFTVSVRPERVEGLVLTGWWFDRLTTNGLMDYLGSTTSL